MNSQFFTMSMVLILVALTLAFVALPTMANPATPLGVRVPRDQRNNPVITRAIRTYRYSVIVSAAVSLVAVFLFSSNPIIAFLPLIPAITALISYALCRQQIVRAKDAEKWFAGKEIVVSGAISSTGEDGKGYPQPRVPWLSFLCALAIILVGAGVVSAQWDQIPAIIPTHFDSSMTPDAWSEKSLSSVFIPSFVSFGLWAFLLIMVLLITHGRSYGRNDMTAVGRIMNAAMLAGMITGLGFLVVAMSIGFAVMQSLLVLAPLSRSGWALLIIMLAVVIGILAVVIAGHRAKKEGEAVIEEAGLRKKNSESPDNDRHYKAGLFYYNPEDPAVIVDKRFGVGLSLNFARWQALALLVGFVGTIFSIVVLAVVNA